MGLEEVKNTLENTIVVSDKGRYPTIFPGVRNLLSWPFDDPAAFEGTDEEKLAMQLRVRFNVFD